MVDAWLTLEHRGHRGEIAAVSRRGLSPSPHREGRPIRLDSADIPLGTELSYFFRWFRDLVRATEKAGGNWRDAVDGVRPFNQRIWQSWPASAKRRLSNTPRRGGTSTATMAPEHQNKPGGAVRQAPAHCRPGSGWPSGGRETGQSVLRQLKLWKNSVSRFYDCTGIVKDVSTGSSLSSAADRSRTGSLGTPVGSAST